MKSVKYEEIKKQVPKIVDYPKEVEIIENFFVEKGLDIASASPVFWNHMITLLERIDDNNQNEIEIDDVEEMSSESKILTEDFEVVLGKSREFNITEFERYMINIHFEQIVKEN